MSGSLDKTPEIVSKIVHIQEEAEKKGKNAGKYITDRCNKIARDVHSDLGVDVDPKTGEMLSEPKCSYRWYAQIMERYRAAVKALGYKHHAIEYHVNAFIRKYQDKRPDIVDLLDPSLPIETLRDNYIKIRSELVSGSQMKRDFTSLKFEHHAFYMFNPKGAVKDWIRDDSDKSLREKLNNQILVNPEWVKQTAHDLLVNKSSTLSDLAIGLALATGRRVTEVMKTAKLTKVDDKTLMFAGQLKTKNRRLFEEVAPYRIPSMVDADIIVKALQRLRKESGKIELSFKDVLGQEVKAKIKGGDPKDYYHNQAVQKYFTSTLNRAIRSLLGDGRFTFKDTRAMYTEVTYEEHAKSGETRSAYRHRVLGHSLIETQLHYDAFKVDSSIEKVAYKTDGDKDIDTNQQEHLIEYLEKADTAVEMYLRAPKVAMMHEWLKDEVKNGLQLDQITPSYIRRHCLIDGKQLNLNTIKKYVDEFIKLSEYEPPKKKAKKPDGKKARERFEIEERLEAIEERQEEITNDQDELDDELESLKERMREIKEEKKELESEHEELEWEESELRERLEELEDEPDDEDDDDDSSTDVEPESEEGGEEHAENQEQDKKLDAGGVPWPDVKDIKVSTRKDGKGYWAKAIVNDHVFEVWCAGARSGAIKSLKDSYKKQTS
ncbi:hypothetical protein QNE52_002883 [Vibrio parahaemolyticus]|nr:hypothetical protein [Vibrio parahaemolyticus]